MSFGGTKKPHKNDQEADESPVKHCPWYRNASGHRTCSSHIGHLGLKGPGPAFLLSDTALRIGLPWQGRPKSGVSAPSTTTVLGAAANAPALAVSVPMKTSATKEVFDQVDP